MDVSSIILNSIKYPFRNLKKLPLLFLFFILIAIVPIGMLLDNKSLIILGGVGFFIFILIVPGYLLSIVKTGSREASALPSFNLVNNIQDSIRVLALRMVYMIVPAIVFLVAFLSLGQTSVNLLYDYNILGFLAAFGFMLLLIVVTYLVFEFLLFFAKARMAYFNSLSEGLKVKNVIGDIRNIGIFTIIKWIVFLVIFMAVVSVVSSFVMTIPYVGFLIYIGIVIPTIESIANYSLGLLYSNIARNSYSLEKYEREIELLK